MEFNSDDDPTATDFNGDGMVDWTFRQGQGFDTDEIEDGFWSPSGPRPPLDTRPTYDFGGVTVIQVRMGGGPLVEPGRGATFWVNVTEGGQHGSIYVTLVETSGGKQKLSLFTN